jgi:hypothetical protein
MNTHVLLSKTLYGKHSSSRISGRPLGLPHTTTNPNSPAYDRNILCSAGGNYSGAASPASGPQSSKVSSTLSLSTGATSRETNGSVSKLISLLWKSNHSLWDARNLDRHGHTPLQNQAIRCNRLQSTVHTLYESGPLMLAADRDIFDLQAATWLEDHHPAHIELWIRASTSIVARSIKDAHHALTHTFHSIADFFSRHIQGRTLEAPTGEPPTCPKNVIPAHPISAQTPSYDTAD